MHKKHKWPLKLSTPLQSAITHQFLPNSGTQQSTNYWTNFETESHMPSNSCQHPQSTLYCLIPDEWISQTRNSIILEESIPFSSAKPFPTVLPEALHHDWPQNRRQNATNLAITVFSYFGGKSPKISILQFFSFSFGKGIMFYF